MSDYQNVDGASKYIPLYLQLVNLLEFYMAPRLVRCLHELSLSSLPVERPAEYDPRCCLRTKCLLRWMNVMPFDFG
jgi:hypothetical protein